METNGNHPSLVQWPLEVFSIEKGNIHTLLDRSFAEAGGKPLILFGDNLDGCELDRRFTGPNARWDQFQALLEKAESTDAEKWLETELSKWGPDGGRFDGRIEWWRCDDWQETLLAKSKEYGELEGPVCDLLELGFFRGREALDYWLVPVEKAWMIPCYLNNPIPNEFIEASEMSALFKRWERIYGAEFCLIDQNGSYCFRVARPPQTMREALLLAREHVGFCGYSLNEQISDPNFAMIELAQCLLGNRTWHFWFD